MKLEEARGDDGFDVVMEADCLADEVDAAREERLAEADMEKGKPRPRLSRGRDSVDDDKSAVRESTNGLRPVELAVDAERNDEPEAKVSSFSNASSARPSLGEGMDMSMTGELAGLDRIELASELAWLGGSVGVECGET